MKIGVLGAGAYGGALGKVLAKKGYEISYYDPYKFPERRLSSAMLSEILILASPAEAVEKLLRKFDDDDFLKPLIVATKGVLEEGVYERFSHVEVISGPGFASEILRGKKALLTVACEGIDLETREGISGETLAETIFRNTNIKFDRTSDVRGVRLLGALKNIFAIEAGRRGLVANGKGERDFWDFIDEAIVESKSVLLHNGGFAETVELAAGRGDLILTCSSAKSRNWQFGREVFGRGENFRKTVRSLGTVEGLFAAGEIMHQGVFVPREAEVLSDILRRIYGIKR